jgi:transposase
MAKIVNPNAAGIDISTKEHYVAVPEESSQENVRCFRSFTRDLHEMAKWLKECGVVTVAMESTGVYWYHLYTVLLDYGFEVYLVNAYHVKNVPGRKSDVSDARWLQQLHSFGLLRGCFQPDNKTRSLRNYVRQRKQLISQMTREVQHMQKALEQMNIKLNNVIRDLQGRTGMDIIRSILDGERNPQMLAKYKQPGIRASKEILIKSLEGNWREEQLFNLKQAYDHHLFLKSQLAECDQECERLIKDMSVDNTPVKEIKAGKKQKNNPDFNANQQLYNALGVDVTKIYGINSVTALAIFSETGPDLKSKFPSEKQFLSWLNVVPDNKITGGKVISSRVKRKKNHAGLAFRDAANGLWNAKNPMGEYLRRKKAISGSRQAIVATARKIASIYYKLVTNKIDFDPQILIIASQEYLNKRLKILEKSIQKTKSLLAINQLIDCEVI